MIVMTCACLYQQDNYCVMSYSKKADAEAAGPVVFKAVFTTRSLHLKRLVISFAFEQEQLQETTGGYLEAPVLSAYKRPALNSSVRKEFA